MKIGIIGLGFVGLSYAVVFASKGYNVVGVDIDVKKVSMISNRVSPFYEDGMKELLETTIGKTFTATTNYDSLRDADLVFVTVNAPTREDGSQDLLQLESAIRELAWVFCNAAHRPIIVIKTTVLPGTTRRMAKLFSELSGKKVPEEMGFAFSPEFLREGCAIRDVLNPSRVIIGALDEDTAESLTKFFREFYIKVGSNPPILVMSPEEAELVKYASNAFLAMRISFANSIADVCEEIPGCDVGRVLEAVGLDPRIGKEYLKPGLGYGGSCLPKDLKALIRFTEDLRLSPILFKAVQRINEDRIEKVIKILERELGDLRGKKVAVLGLAFKPGTDDIRDSQALKLVLKLLNKGARVYVHDPMALTNAKRILGNRVEYLKSLDKVLEYADIAIIATGWDHYKQIPLLVERKDIRTKLIIDSRRILCLDELSRMQNKGLKVIVLGTNLGK